MIGVVDPMGPTTTVCELQARTVAYLWSTGYKFPPKEKMVEEIEKEKEITRRRFKCSARKASLQVSEEYI